MGLLSGLGGLGLGNLEGMSLYEDADRSKSFSQEPEETVTEEKIDREANHLFEKNYQCKVCGKNFKALSVMAGKARLTGTDTDLRPRYEGVEPLKYDVVMCPACGYASLNKYWGILTENQIRTIRSEISKTFRPVSYKGYEYTYEEGLERYQMALANAIVKQAKTSEKAYICLKAGWLLRSKAEAMDPVKEAASYNEVCESENEYLKNALEGLVNARRTETFPICGMDESTLDYLIAALSVRFKQYEQAAKLVGRLLTNSGTNPRIKEKARDLKEQIVDSMKKQNS